MRKGLTKIFLCGEKSPVGDFAEFVVGSALSCWCCSFWRGVLLGFIAGVVVGYVVTVGVLL